MKATLSSGRSDPGSVLIQDSARIASQCSMSRTQSSMVMMMIAHDVCGCYIIESRTATTTKKKIFIANYEYYERVFIVLAHVMTTLLLKFPLPFWFTLL